MLTRILSRYWFLLPILVLVVIALDRIETPATIEIEETINMRDTRSDYYMADFKSRKYRSDGTLEYTIQGNTLAHYPQNDHSEIIAPKMHLNRSGGTWDISSSSGRFDTNPDLFTLRGDVIMHRRRDDSELITIKTEALTVETESNQVSTTEPIEIVSAHWALKAIGMTSAIDDGTLSLLSQVSARYEVPSE